MQDSFDLSCLRTARGRRPLPGLFGTQIRPFGRVYLTTAIPSKGDVRLRSLPRLQSPLDESSVVGQRVSPIPSRTTTSKSREPPLVRVCCPHSAREILRARCPRLVDGFR